MFWTRVSQLGEAVAYFNSTELSGPSYAQPHIGPPQIRMQVELQA
jgi:hypothetical protein